jgi:hypothetical protein
VDPTDDPGTVGTEGSVTAWIGALRGGDSDAAAHRLWDRYFDRLVDLARARLRFAARGPDDEEDAALSAFESLCRGVTEGRFVRLEGRDELWRLMATINARKAADRIEREGPQKRGGGRVRGEAELDGPGERPDLAEYAARFPRAAFRAARPRLLRVSARADCPGATLPDTPTAPGTAATAGTVARAGDQAPGERPGSVVGRSHLLEEIGRGGMGMVFLAEQHQPGRRRVALKVIRPGLDSEHVVARFEWWSTTTANSKGA